MCRLFTAFIFILSLLASSLQAVDVWVTIAPQKFFVEKVGGDLVSVTVLVKPGQSPELYAPSAAQLAKLARADAYIGIGMPVEHKVIPRIEASMSSVRVLQTGELNDAHHHEHHEGCVHGDQDPHIWMDPIAMQSKVDQICELLSALLPDAAEVFEANAVSLKAELAALDRDLAERFTSHEGRAFYINHPSLGHFAERYGLLQHSLEQAGTAPSARRIAGVIKTARADRVGAVFTQPEFGKSSASVLAQALGVDVVEVNPLAEDYIGNLKLIAKVIEESFRND